MRTISIIIFISASSFLFQGCSQQPLDGQDYRSYVENPANQLKQEKQLEDLQMELQYKPFAYIAMQEEQSYELTQAQLGQKQEEFGSLQYYNFSIVLQNGGTDVIARGAEDEDTYQQLINYFSYGLKDDLKLVQGGDTLNCSLFHFARNFNISPSVDFAIAFDDKGNNADRQFIWDDKVFGLGTVKLTVPGTAVGDLPKLKTNA
jgi:hypothetical protein